jgi:hypothetical protein
VFDVINEKLMQVFWKDKNTYDTFSGLYSAYSEKCFHHVRKGGEEVKRIHLEYLKSQSDALKELLTTKNFENEFVGCMLWAAWNGYPAVRFVSYAVPSDTSVLPDFPK